MTQTTTPNPWPKYRCKKCSDVITSEYSGQYVACTCGAIAVDQTEYYSRFIGKLEYFEKVE